MLIVQQDVFQSTEFIIQLRVEEISQLVIGQGGVDADDMDVIEGGDGQFVFFRGVR